MPTVPPTRISTKNGTAHVDPDSDEELETDLHTFFDGNDIGRAYHAIPMRHPAQVVDVAQPLPTHIPVLDPSSTTESGEINLPKADRKQGASVMMNIFAPHLDDIQDAILATKYHHDLESGDCQCGAPLAPFRCTDCFSTHLSCAKCLIGSHVNLPFHRITQWNGAYFDKACLNDIGMVLYLGHQGDPCPNRDANNKGRTFIIGEINGFHKLSIAFCRCFEAGPDHLQLIKARLFPATITQPETVFTFGLLENWYMHTLTSKKSAHDYHDALRKLTDPVFPHEIPDRTQEFTRVSRIWRHLSDVRRSGQAHGIDEFFPLRREKSATVRCPACPEVGVNVSQDVIDNAHEDEIHKYTLFISADGNFRLQRKNKNNDPDDVALNDGHGYFVETTKYQEYLAHLGEEKDNCTCAHLRAVRLQNIIKFKNAAVSGVISIVCARHGFFLPQGTADLVRGEGYSHTDYVFVFALSDPGQHLLRWFMLSYDIWCSYKPKMRARFEKQLKNSTSLVDRLRGAVPKMHIKNHIDACQQLWSFNFLKYSGETYGEIIETVWAENNQAAGSTKEQNGGHRHDTLDNFFGYWNWTKSIRIHRSLYRSYTSNLETLKRREAEFYEYSKAKAKYVGAWKQRVDEKPYYDKKGKLVSVYEVQWSKGPPTQKQAYEKLIQEEKVKQFAGMHSLTGLTQFINHGLNIEKDQLRIRLMAVDKSASQDKLATERQKVLKELIEWRQRQFQLFPRLQEQLKLDKGRLVEDEPLLLPSQVNQAHRTYCGLSEAAHLEYTLREGQAHDALDSLRLAIKVYNHNVAFKQKNVHGQGPNTRSQAYLKTLQDDKLKAFHKYQQARAALLNLGLDSKDKVLQPLEKSQLYLTKNRSGPLKLGDSKKEDPWYWSVGRAAGSKDVKNQEAESQEWELEVDRVKWFQDRAARNRAREEKEILEEEFRRAIASFEKSAAAWRQLAENSSKRPGASAYARKQAAMYSRLQDGCQKSWEQAQIKQKEYETWYESQKFDMFHAE